MASDPTWEKCAEIFRNNSGKYCFYCSHCDETTVSGYDILRHLESHFNVDSYLADAWEKYNFDSSEIECKDATIITNESLEDNIWIKEGPIINDSHLAEQTAGTKSIKEEMLLETDRSVLAEEEANYWGNDGDVHNTKPYKCELCSKRLMSAKLLESHMNSKHKPGQKCRKCKESFAHSKLLSKHLRRDHDMAADLVYHSIFKCKPFKCDECSEPFKDRGALKTHLIEVHARTEFARDPYKCDLCGKWYGTARKLEEHIAEIHATYKPFKCETCDSRYSSRYVLRLAILFMGMANEFGFILDLR